MKIDMDVLDKVIEKYTGVHRRSIVERDVQNIYQKVFDIIEDKIFWDEEIKEINYNCKCLNKSIKIDVEFSDNDYVQCYGDIDKIILVVPLNCLDEYNHLHLINEKDACIFGFRASLYCLFWDLMKDKSYKLKKHKYKSFGDSFNKNSLEDLHDLAVLILNKNDNENKDKTICFANPPSFYQPKFYSL